MRRPKTPAATATAPERHPVGCTQRGVSATATKRAVTRGIDEARAGAPLVAGDAAVGPHDRVEVASRLLGAISRAVSDRSRPTWPLPVHVIALASRVAQRLRQRLRVAPHVVGQTGRQRQRALQALPLHPRPVQVHRGRQQIPQRGRRVVQVQAGRPRFWRCHAARRSAPAASDRPRGTPARGAAAPASAGLRPAVRTWQGSITLVAMGVFSTDGPTFFSHRRASRRRVAAGDAAWVARRPARAGRQSASQESVRVMRSWREAAGARPARSRPRPRISRSPLCSASRVGDAVGTGCRTLTRICMRRR